MKINYSTISILILISAFLLTIPACTSSNAVIANNANISQYKYVCFGKEQTGDRRLDDIMMLVQNEITDSKLKPINREYAPYDYIGHTLSPHINIQSGERTYITITFYDWYTNQSIAVIKSSGYGMVDSHDQKLALGAIRKKL